MLLRLAASICWSSSSARVWVRIAVETMPYWSTNSSVLSAPRTTLSPLLAVSPLYAWRAICPTAVRIFSPRASSAAMVLGEGHLLVLRVLRGGRR